MGGKCKTRNMRNGSISAIQRYMVSVHPWCIFVLYWLSVVTVVSFESCVKRQRTAFLILSGEIMFTLSSKPFPGGLEMTSRGMYTVKSCSRVHPQLG